MKRIREYFSSWNLFEIAYLFIGLFLSLYTTLRFRGTLLQFLYSACFTLAAIFLSKGKIECYFFSIISNLSYGILCYFQNYFGEMAIALLMHVPLSFVSLLKWKKHLREEDAVVTIQKLTKKELLTVFAVQTVLFPVYYAVLKFFNTDRLVLSTVSLIFSLCSSYFQYRISIWSLYCYSVYDILIMTMWILPALNGDLSMITNVLATFLLLVSDFYGIYNWKKMTREQNSGHLVNS